MMGSRGDPSAQVTAYATLLEFIDLLRNGDKILPAGVAELRAAEKAARDAWADVDKANEALAAHRAELVERQRAFSDQQTTFSGQVALHQAKAAEIARQETTFAEQRTTLEARKQELDRSVAAVEGDRAEFEAAKMLHASDHQAKVVALVEETDRRLREAEATIQRARDRAAADIDQMRKKAQAEITAAQERLQAREDGLKAREEQLHKERARISALLRE
jgi:chromosome segregation ATPase